MINCIQFTLDVKLVCVTTGMFPILEHGSLKNCWYFLLRSQDLLSVSTVTVLQVQQDTSISESCTSPTVRCSWHKIGDVTSLILVHHPAPVQLIYSIQFGPHALTRFNSWILERRMKPFSALLYSFLHLFLFSFFFLLIGQDRSEEARLLQFNCHEANHHLWHNSSAWSEKVEQLFCPVVSATPRVRISFLFFSFLFRTETQLLTTWIQHPTDLVAKFTFLGRRAFGEELDC